MVKKKRVLVTIMVIVMVAATISAGVVGRGGFGGYQAASVVADEESSDTVTRPIQRWQTLTDEELAACPLYAEGVDVEEFRAFQAERFELMQDAQFGAGYGAGRSYGPSKGYPGASTPFGGRNTVGNQFQGQQYYYGRHMMYQPNAAQGSYGPARARW
jgi:hypothetical protein